MSSSRVKKVLVRIALGVLAVLVAIQFIPVQRDNPPITAKVEAPAEVLAILERSCFDCHSHETNWPWYSYIAPISWLVEEDIHEAREELNFSTWDVYDAERRAHKISEAWEEVEEGEMPLPIYLVMHSEAKLSDGDRAVLRDWARRFGEGEEHGAGEEHGEGHREEGGSGH